MPATKQQNHLCQLTFTYIATLFCVVWNPEGSGRTGEGRGGGEERGGEEGGREGGM